MTFKICNSCLKDGIDKDDNLTTGMPSDYCSMCGNRKPRSLNYINVQVEQNTRIGNLDFWLVTQKPNLDKER